MGCFKGDAFYLMLSPERRLTVYGITMQQDTVIVLKAKDIHRLQRERERERERERRERGKEREKGKERV